MRCTELANRGGRRFTEHKREKSRLNGFHIAFHKFRHPIADACGGILREMHVVGFRKIGRICHECVKIIHRVAVFCGKTAEKIISFMHEDVVFGLHFDARGAGVGHGSACDEDELGIGLISAQDCYDITDALLVYIKRDACVVAATVQTIVEVDHVVAITIQGTCHEVDLGGEDRVARTTGAAELIHGDASGLHDLLHAVAIASRDAVSDEKHAAYVGKTARCLVDGLSGDESYPLAARTPGNRLVRVAGDEALVGSFCEVEITGANKWSLFGKAL